MNTVAFNLRKIYQKDKVNNLFALYLLKIFNFSIVNNENNLENKNLDPTTFNSKEYNP
jgi:hypothetical protein